MVEPPLESISTSFKGAQWKLEWMAELPSLPVVVKAWVMPWD